MASLGNAVLCAILGTAFWSFLGYALARRLLPRVLAIGAAPVLGWAVHSAAALPIFELTGFSPPAVLGFAGLCLAAAAGSFFVARPGADLAEAPTVPAWAYAAAAILALVPAAAILPKFSSDGVSLADQIFDHSKIALIDAMVRQGLPPVDPTFGAHGEAGAVAYYYLWHFSAAELALVLNVIGWDADIGLTWFAAFASLTLVMALAVWLSGDRRAAILVIVLALAGSLRTTLGWVFHPETFIWQGLDGWLYQSAWVPQHLISASCTLTAMLLVARYAYQPGISLLLVPTLALTVAAGFESSTYVGGVTFGLGALAAAPVLLARIDPKRRLGFAVGLAVAGVLVACLIAPFVIAQLATVAARHDPTPVVVHPFDVLGEISSPWLRYILNLPAYWLLELPISLPAIFVPGLIALFIALRSSISHERKTTVAVLACLAGAGLVAAWLLMSTVGENNDLGWRAVLPPVLILIAVTAAGIMRSPRRTLIAALALGGLVLSLPETIDIVRSSFIVESADDADTFADTPELWQAVRRYAGPTDRVGNNPLFLQDLTSWPANLSWALLANRGSCFSGRELAMAFAPLPAARRDAINAQFIRVFEGKGTPADIDQMARVYDCKVVVVVPDDDIWDKDPFASSPDYRLAESREHQWRIYVRKN
jgi:hypothetical protein